MNTSNDAVSAVRAAYKQVFARQVDERRIVRGMQQSSQSLPESVRAEYDAFTTYLLDHVHQTRAILLAFINRTAKATIPPPEHITPERGQQCASVVTMCSQQFSQEHGFHAEFTLYAELLDHVAIGDLPGAVADVLRGDHVEWTFVRAYLIVLCTEELKAGVDLFTKLNGMLIDGTPYRVPPSQPIGAAPVQADRMPPSVSTSNKQQKQSWMDRMRGKKNKERF